jgi:hypothetical protein
VRKPKTWEGVPRYGASWGSETGMCFVLSWTSGSKCLGHFGVLVVAFSAPERCIKQCCLHMLASMARIGSHGACVCKLI